MAAMRLSKSYYSKPIVVILGCTGTGKSKLAIEIAKKFNGEVVNADAMQLYEGLDIITNKVKPEEQGGIKHHLLGILNPFNTLVVWEYKILALKAIKEIIDRKKLPIIVGGTYYYVESILYDFVLGAPSGVEYKLSDDEKEDFDAGRLLRENLKIEECNTLLAKLRELDNETLYERLKEVDPEMAEKTHPNYRRKILRSIMVYHQYGETLSSILDKQRSQPGGCSSGGPLQFVNSVVLLLKCEEEVLKERLDKRVEDMMSRGLLDEILEFYKKCDQESLAVEKGEKKGVYQSIGLKEFYKYLILEEEKRETEEGKTLLKEGENLLKIATRKYAKRQSRWVVNRFLKDSQRQVPLIYGLDATDLSKWEENVSRIAEDVVESHLAGKKPSIEPLPVEGEKAVLDKIYRCECGSILEGKMRYESHLKTKKHLKQLEKKRKLEEEESESKATEINPN